MIYFVMPEEKEKVIKVAHLTKRFGRTVAVDDISFEITRGEIVGFLGPNGAGKTTTMRLLSCFLPPTGGEVSIAGMDILRDSVEIRRNIGYLPENAPLYDDMRVKEYLSYRGKLKGLRGKKLKARLNEVTASCGLTDMKDRIIARLSKGYKQRVALADSLINEPPVLILDEPTIGLDPNQIRHIRDLIRGLAERHTVLLSSHILPEIEMICQRVLIINKGKIVASDTTEGLARRVEGCKRVAVEVQGPKEVIVNTLSGIIGVERVACESTGNWHRLLCECNGEIDVRRDIFRIVSENKWDLRELQEEKKSLEDVFTEITGRTTEEGQ